MKQIVAIVVLALALPLAVFAAPSAPTQAVWVTPSDAKPGDKVEISALVYNSTKTDASVTVVFSEGAQTIGTTTITVPKESGKTATISWIMPSTQVNVVVKSTKAVTVKDKKALSALVGDIGTVSVGATALAKVGGFPGTDSIKEWVTVHLAGIEAWRIKQAEHFADLRDTAKRDLGITVARKVEEKIAQEIAGIEPDKASSVDSQNNPKDYVILIGSTALASLFGSMLMFYVVAILLALFIIRFIIRRFI